MFSRPFPYRIRRSDLCRGRHFAWETTFAAGISAHRAGAARSCSIQLITDAGSRKVEFPISAFSKYGSGVRIGANRFSPRGIRMDLPADPPSAMTSWGRSAGCRGWNAAPQTKSRPSGAAGLGEEGQRKGRRALTFEKSVTERICKEKSAIFGRRLPILVPVVGLEPTRCRHLGILSPVRLPIPPHRPTR